MFIFQGFNVTTSFSPIEESLVEYKWKWNLVLRGIPLSIAKKQTIQI